MAKCPSCGSIKQLEVIDGLDQPVVSCGACGWGSGPKVLTHEELEARDLVSKEPPADGDFFKLPYHPLETVQLAQEKTGGKPKLGPRTPWPETMLALAKAMAARSRDDTTRVGAVVCDSRWRVIGTGYNGGPAGSPVTLPSGGPERHLYTVHAEENALLQAVAMCGPIGLGWSLLFSTHRPCARCLRLAKHVGIESVTFSLDQLSIAQAHEADTIERQLYFPVGSRVHGPRTHESQRR